jgi:hypothetical protein
MPSLCKLLGGRLLSMSSDACLEVAPLTGVEDAAKLLRREDVDRLFRDLGGRIFAIGLRSISPSSSSYRKSCWRERYRLAHIDTDSPASSSETMNDSTCSVVMEATAVGIPVGVKNARNLRIRRLGVRVPPSASPSGAMVRGHGPDSRVAGASRCRLGKRTKAPAPARALGAPQIPARVERDQELLAAAVPLELVVVRQELLDSLVRAGAESAVHGMAIDVRVLHD